MIAPLCCKIQRETFSEVTVGFDNKLTASLVPVLLGLSGCSYCFDRCQLPAPLDISGFKLEVKDEYLIYFN